MDKKIKENLEFFRKYVMKNPELKDLPTMEDMDESKLPAVEKLLKNLLVFNQEMNSVGLFSVSGNKKYPIWKNSFTLTDTGFKNWDRFCINVEANHFDSEWKFALHAGLGFHLYLIQDGYRGRGEIADWINICIEYMNTTPMCFISTREHVRVLQYFFKETNSYFSGLGMEFETCAIKPRLE